MRGTITETDFDEVECAFPGIVRYYRDLKVKPDTFLELLWAFMNQDCRCADSVPVAPRTAIASR